MARFAVRRLERADLARDDDADRNTLQLRGNGIIGFAGRILDVNHDDRVPVIIDSETAGGREDGALPSVTTRSK